MSQSAPAGIPSMSYITSKLSSYIRRDLYFAERQGRGLVV